MRQHDIGGRLFKGSGFALSYAEFNFLFQMVNLKLFNRAEISTLTPKYIYF